MSLLQGSGKQSEKYDRRRKRTAAQSDIKYAPPGLLNPDGTLPMYVLKEREAAARELEEIKKRKPQTEPTIQAAPASAEEVGELWRCECGAENTGTFCRDCGRGKL